MSLLFFSSCNYVSAWASASSFDYTPLTWPSNFENTHEYIIEEAYNLLREDSAYSTENFPSLEELKNWEGFNFEGQGGPGQSPDGTGNSNFSEHYYNPITQQGDLPQAAAQHYEEKKYCGEPSRDPCGCDGNESKFCFSPGCPTCAAESDWANAAEAFIK